MCSVFVPAPAQKLVLLHANISGKPLMSVIICVKTANFTDSFLSKPIFIHIFHSFSCFLSQVNSFNMFSVCNHMQVWTCVCQVEKLWKKTLENLILETMLASFDLYTERRFLQMMDTCFLNSKLLLFIYTVLVYSNTALLSFCIPKCTLGLRVMIYECFCYM